MEKALMALNVFEKGAMFWFSHSQAVIINTERLHPRTNKSESLWGWHLALVCLKQVVISTFRPVSEAVYKQGTVTYQSAYHGTKTSKDKRKDIEEQNELTIPEVASI
jgi:hypothetical protein